MKDTMAGEGYHSVNPYILIDGAEDLMTFLGSVFGGVVTERLTRPDGRIGHGEIRVGDSVVMVSDSTESFPARAAAHYIFVDDVDSAFRRAIDAGATALRGPADQFYGNREAGVVDGWGNLWWIASVIEVVSDEEIERRWESAKPSGSDGTRRD